jgi:hypothetical protein
MQTEQKTKKAPATSNSHLGTHPFQVQTEQKTKKAPATFKSHLGTHPFQVQTEQKTKKALQLLTAIWARTPSRCRPSTLPTRKICMLLSACCGCCCSWLT